MAKRESRVKKLERKYGLRTWEVDPAKVKQKVKAIKEVKNPRIPPMKVKPLELINSPTAKWSIFSRKHPYYARLNPMMRDFVDEYLKQRGDAYKAGLSIGFSASTAKARANELLKREEIRNAIDERRAEAEDVSKLQIADVIRELMMLAFSDIANIATWGSDGRLVLRPSHELPPEITSSIAEISEIGDGDKRRLKVRLYDKTKALEMLGKFLGGLVDRHEITSNVQVARDFSRLDSSELRMLLELSEKICDQAQRAARNMVPQMTDIEDAEEVDTEEVAEDDVEHPDA